MTVDAAASIPTWTIGDRLRKAREHAHLEQQELAEKIGLSRGSISAYELGRTIPKRPQLLAISMATGVPMAWLQTGETAGLQGPDGTGLPPLDSNQQPAGSRFAQVTALSARSSAGRATRHHLPTHLEPAVARLGERRRTREPVAVERRSSAAFRAVA